MAEDKELLKKDIVKIIKFDSVTNYENVEEVKKIHDSVAEENMFSTFIGQRYIKKLEQVLKDNQYNCFFCDSEIADKKLICNECLSKLHLKKEQPAQENHVEDDSTEANSIEQHSPQEDPVQEDLVQEYIIQEDSIQEDLVQEDSLQETVVLKEEIEEIKEIKSTEIKKTYHFKDFGNGLSKTVKMVVIAAFLIFAITIIGVSINKKDSPESFYSVEISSVDDAMLVLESIFPSEEYNLKFQQQLYPAKEMFEGEVGEYCGENWSNKKKIDAYLFTVQSIETPSYSCMCYVSIDGRVVGYGNLIYEADTSAFFRLK